ncbi:MAG: trehalase family glycosidase, partial [Gemmatimonadales bacterium]|nr:trehalase family glycosidase [Gemmatimonadales bacterium]
MDHLRVTASAVRGALCAGLLAVAACATGARPSDRPAVGPSARYDPPRDLGQLFHDVQVSGIFEDSKTFVDAQPRLPPDSIRRLYDGGVTDLRAFVERHFELPAAAVETYRSDTAQSMEEHLRALWPVLIRGPPSGGAAQYSSLIPLPAPYVVPGGRFREIYYWDTYFTMLGLVESGHTELVRDMLDNFAHLVRTIGHIRNGNRTFYLHGSQPPYFAAMVGL